MSTVKLLTSPLWFPFWLVWNILAFIGRTLWAVITFSIKVAIVLAVIFGLIAWFWW
jgi:hypothetical protein